MVVCYLFGPGFSLLQSGAHFSKQYLPSSLPCYTTSSGERDGFNILHLFVCREKKKSQRNLNVATRQSGVARGTGRYFAA